MKRTRAGEVRLGGVSEGPAFWLLIWREGVTWRQVVATREGVPIDVPTCCSEEKLTFLGIRGES